MDFEIGNFSPPPEYHILDFEKVSSLPQFQVKWKYQRFDFDWTHLTKGSLVRVPHRGPERWEVGNTHVLFGRRYFSLINPAGEVYLFKALFCRPNFLFARCFRRRSKVIFPTPCLSRLPTLSQRHRGIDPAIVSQKSVKIFIQALLAESATIGQLSETDQKHYKHEVSHLIEQLLKMDELTADRLDEFAAMIHPIAGILGSLYQVRRGQRRHITLNSNRNITVDLTRSENYSQNVGFEGYTRFVHAYCPAPVVVSKLQKLLDAINTFVPGSSAEFFNFLASVYQRFIMIHPYLDGNGRLARLILVHLMIKHGFHPQPGFRFPREALYCSVEQLTHHLICRYCGCSHGVSINH